MVYQRLDRWSELAWKPGQKCYFVDVQPSPISMLLGFWGYIETNALTSTIVKKCNFGVIEIWKTKNFKTFRIRNSISQPKVKTFQETSFTSKKRLDCRFLVLVIFSLSHKFSLIDFGPLVSDNACNFKNVDKSELCREKCWNCLCPKIFGSAYLSAAESISVNFELVWSPILHRKVNWRTGNLLDPVNCQNYSATYNQDEWLIHYLIQI